MAEGANKLRKLLADPTITEIMVNGPKATWLEVKGSKYKIEVTFSEEDLKDIIDVFFTRVGKNISYYNPYGDVCTEDGSRLNIIQYPLSRCGTTLTVRKFDRQLHSLDDLIANGTMSQKMGEFLIACIKGRINVLFSGATGSGKTTTMEMLSHHIPEQERLVTIEDTAELILHQDNLVPMETRTPDQDGKGEVTLKDLIRNALRMRPDRIIVGEVRGPEALDMIQAMSTGHRGTLAVIHANSPQEVTNRMETLILSSGIKLPIEEIRRMIGNTINVVVQQERYPDGIRRVSHISELRGLERREVAIQDLFIFRREGRTEDGKIKGKFLTVMRNYPRFFPEFNRLGLLDEKAFSEYE
ncbi:MAG: Flp pilus assembly complex ATPase component TadA [Candidatus Omnitrophica bacterium]|nr:Flp pilus assembly complex ATPase component TadA [Candidatus Omnitrophota bacterium]MBU2044939.1 Flp pilus assembly complex ATPase component TadA [Candidatus Omnitrophota bacterium]MBU2251731.1 Flp pilus assembly complex ATPase component TadA [Candidatus Omnitrophota bacterium]MBU2265604.1 Flp pilus assembly complex ATPase component TadA [Candidatus Omnitrophota bacterium]